MFSRACLAALCALVAACSSSGGDGTCVNSADCASGQLCISGRCVNSKPDEGCTRDENCAANQYCDGNGECQTRTGADVVVIGGLDALPPGVDALPPNDDATVTPPDDSGVSGPDGGPDPSDTGVGPTDVGPTCTTDQQCTPPSTICIASACVPGCGQNAALCGATELCNTNTGRCVPRPTTCAMDSQCAPPATVCESTQCVPGCGQAGGIQCAAPTPICNMTTGRCEPMPGCARDSDCGNADQICVSNACVLRCDRPGAAACAATTVCNAADGRCIPGNLALGADCAIDEQCQTRVCLGLTINGSARNVCTQGCGRSVDCPLDYGCLYISGMNFCLSENLFTPPATFDVRVGGACSQTDIRCQSGWCNPTAGQCLETCSREGDCAALGGNCFMYSQTAMTPATYDHICVAQTNSVIGATCAVNTSCRTGICNRYAQQCAAHCCSDADCGATQVCGLYDIDTTTGDLTKVCGPRTPGAGALPIGSACTNNTDCDSEICIPANTSANPPMQCSTLCCTNADCGQIPNGRCIPLGGPTVGAVSTIVGACVSVP